MDIFFGLLSLPSFSYPILFAPRLELSTHSPNLSGPWALFTDFPKIVSVSIPFITEDLPSPLPPPQDPFKLPDFGSYQDQIPQKSLWLPGPFLTSQKPLWGLSGPLYAFKKVLGSNSPLRPLNVFFSVLKLFRISPGSFMVSQETFTSPGKLPMTLKVRFKYSQNIFVPRLLGTVA